MVEHHFGKVEATSSSLVSSSIQPLDNYITMEFMKSIAEWFKPAPDETWIEEDVEEDTEEGEPWVVNGMEVSTYLFRNDLDYMTSVGWGAVLDRLRDGRGVLKEAGHDDLIPEIDEALLSTCYLKAHKKTRRLLEQYYDLCRATEAHYDDVFDDKQVSHYMTMVRCIKMLADRN